MPDLDPCSTFSAAKLPMEAAPILVFGSQGSDFLPAFDPLILISRQLPILQTFFSLALENVRNDLKSIADRHDVVHSGEAESEDLSLIADDIEMLPHLPPFHIFSDLKTMLGFHAQSRNKDSIVNGVLLCLLHCATVVAILSIELALEHPNRAVDISGIESALLDSRKALLHPNTNLLGFCTGIFSAWAAGTLPEMSDSSCVNVWSFVEQAITAVRICFWIGLRSKQARNRLARSNCNDEKSLGRWSIVVTTKSPDQIVLAEDLLGKFNAIAQKRSSCASPLVVTAHALNQVSIGGPPDLLQDLMQYLTQSDGPQTGLRSSFIEIYSPYHTAELESELEAVMQDLNRRGILQSVNSPTPGRTLWDTASAGILSETAPLDMVRRLVDSNLCSTAKWDAMVDNMVLLEKFQHEGSQRSRAVINMGPGNSLVMDIKKRFNDDANGASDNSVTTVFDIPSLLRDWIKQTTAPAVTSPAPFLGDPSVEGEDIVIVSMACRFPGDVRTPEQLWTCLETGRNTVSEIPKHLFDIDRYYGTGINQTLARHMHALPEDVTTTMDARLFSMSPKEIEQLDPQHRLTMLCAYEALERAGYSFEPNSPSSFDRKRIAICMGASWDDYRENASHNIGSYFITGNIRAFIPGHVSFSLKWEGPSVSVDSLECTAVSAVEWAKKALLSHQCDVALAGAVNVLTQPQMFISMDKEGILSRTGTNATFSSKLDGKTRGDGCGILLLKRRSTAVRDGDTILASVKAAGTAFHRDSFENEASVSEQAEFLTLLLERSSVSKDSIVHVEASGFHTQIAEAREFEGFKRLFCSESAASDSSLPDISISSSRPNLGAGESVSAMAGIMKAVLMLQKGVVPRHLAISHPSELQSSIRTICQETRLFVPTEAKMLPTPSVLQTKRSILVNSLASTGCQGAVLLQEADNACIPKKKTILDSRGVWAFTLSARTAESLEHQRKTLLDYLYRDVDLADLSYTLTCRRTHHPFRLTVVASEKEELLLALRRAKSGEAKLNSELPSVCFVFPADLQGQNDLRTAMIAQDEGLRDRYESLLLSTEEQFDSAQGLDSLLHQSVLSLLLKDCGVEPETVTGSNLPYFVSTLGLDLASCKLLQNPNMTDMSGAAKGVENFMSSLSAPRLIDYVLAPRGSHLSDVSEQVAEESSSGAVAVSSPEKLWLEVGDTVSIVDEDPNRDTKADRQLYRTLLETLAALHQRGYTISWIELHRPYLFQLNMLHDLPTYGFHLQRHWMDYHDRNLTRPVEAFDGLRTNASDSLNGEVEESPYDTDSESDHSSAGPVDLPDQPLLSSVLEDSSFKTTYLVNLGDEENLAAKKVLASGSFLGPAIELLVEAYLELRSKRRGDGAELDVGCLCLGNIRFPDLTDLLHETLSLRLHIQETLDPLSGLSYKAEAVAEEGKATLVSGDLFAKKRDDRLRPWSKLVSILKDRVSKIMAEGEVMGARLVYRSIQSTAARTLKPSDHIIRKVFALNTSREAVVSCRLPNTDTFAETSLQLPPLLLSALELSGTWYCGHLCETAESKVAVSQVGSIDFSSQIRNLFGNQGQSEAEFYVYISSESTTKEDFIKDAGLMPALNLLLMDKNLEVVGELQSVRFTATSKQPTKAAAQPANGTNLAATQANAAQVSPPSAPPANGQAASAPEAPRQGKKSKATVLHEKVIQVLAAELGISVDEITPTVKLPDLGLDSLMSLVCISTLESLNLGFPIPQSLFLERDSPAELLDWIKSQVGDDVEELDDYELTNGAAATSTDPQATIPLQSSSAENCIQHAADVATTNGASNQSGPCAPALEEAMLLVTTTIETELGVEPGSIADDANLADLGMDSLMSLLVLGSLSPQVSFELPASLFLDCLTLRDIRTFFASKLLPAQPSANTTSVADSSGRQEMPGVSTQLRSVPVDKFTVPSAKLPVLLQPASGAGSSKVAASTPLFLLPDGSGMATVYKFLPPIDRPIYSINSPFLSNATDWKCGVEQIAAYYLSCIKLVQPQGPWLIGGWSFGGMVAFEIARMLAGRSTSQNSNEKQDIVSGLFLLDSPCPTKYPPLPMSIVDWIFSAPEVKDIAPPALSPKLLAHFRATVENLATYRPVPIKGRWDTQIYYIVPQEPLPGKIEDVKEKNETVHWLFRRNRPMIDGPDGWDSLVPPQNVHVIGIPQANHFTLVREPAISKVMLAIQEGCQKSRS